MALATQGGYVIPRPTTGLYKAVVSQYAICGCKMAAPLPNPYESGKALYRYALRRVKHGGE